MSINKVKIHFLREQGKHFVELAQMFGGTAKEMASICIEVEEKRNKFKNKEKVVYKKRINLS